MIRRLRRRHLRMWIVLAVVLPVLYWIAIAARAPAPVIERLPAPLADTGTDGAAGGRAP